MRHGLRRGVAVFGGLGRDGESVGFSPMRACAAWVCVANRPSSAMVAAVAANNLAVVRGSRDLFDSVKRVKAALGVAGEKLTETQKRALAINHAILMCHMHKVRLPPLACRGAHVVGTMKRWWWPGVPGTVAKF